MAGMEPRLPALGAQSLSHWTTRAVPFYQTSLTISLEGSSEVGKADRRITALKLEMFIEMFRSEEVLCLPDSGFSEAEGPTGSRLSHETVVSLPHRPGTRATPPRLPLPQSARSGRSCQRLTKLAAASSLLQSPEAQRKERQGTPNC